MNIIIAINEKYIEPAKTMLYSLACQQSEHLVVYLLQSSIRQKKLDELSTFVSRKCHGELQIVQINKDLFANVPKNKWLSEETYYRLISFELLPRNIERALWLDADIIVKGNISEFYAQEFDGNYAVACAKGAIEHHQRLKLSETHRYFNAGVVLYNLLEIRQHFSVQDIFDCVEENRNNLLALDQDVLNILFENKVKYDDADVYNYGIFGFSVINREEMKMLKRTARIIHFLGAMKPWNYKGANWADTYWWRYERKRGRRMLAYVEYRLKNTPVKITFCIRELYYLVLGQIQKKIK